MNMKSFSGTITALVTPFRNGAINYQMMSQLLERQIAAGIHGIVVAGTTGEGATLTDDERLELIGFCKEYVSDRCGVIASTGSNCTKHAKALAKAAQDRGADGLLIVTPYYNKANSSGLLSHYETIAEAVTIPILLYNVPTRTGMDISIPMYDALSKLRNVIGVKEASPDVGKVQKIKAACHADFRILSGNDDMICASMALGAKGVISVASNLFPEAVKKLTDAAEAGDYAHAAYLQRQLLPLIEMLFCEVNPVPVKAAMKMIGFDCGECRLPLGNLSQGNQDALEAIVKQMESYDSSVSEYKM